MKDIYWVPSTPDDTGWKTRHQRAIFDPKEFEQPIITMLHGWLIYAERHQKQYESPIGDDGVLGVEWAHIGRGILGLLNGDCGRLDCGTLDTIIRDNLAEQGFHEET